VETKARAVQWAKAMDSRYANRFGGTDGSEAIVRMHFSGCPASCAQPQVADIGFRGETAHVGDEIVEAVDIGLGGSLGVDAAFGDWVDGAVPVSEVVEVLGRTVDRFFSEAVPGERFHEWARRVPMAALRSTLRGEPSQQGSGSTDGPWTEEEPAP
jgi:ferredoxin-nitrite reductase